MAVSTAAAAWRSRRRSARRRPGIWARRVRPVESGRARPRILLVEGVLAVRQVDLDSPDASLVFRISFAGLAGNARRFDFDRRFRFRHWRLRLRGSAAIVSSVVASIRALRHSRGRARAVAAGDRAGRPPGYRRRSVARGLQILLVERFIRVLDRRRRSLDRRRSGRRGHRFDGRHKRRRRTSPVSHDDVGDDADRQDPTAAPDQRRVCRVVGDIGVAGPSRSGRRSVPQALQTGRRNCRCRTATPVTTVRGPRRGRRRCRTHRPRAPVRMRRQ